MVGIKTVADTLTSVRFLLGLYLIWLGLRGGPEAVAAAALTLLVAWASRWKRSEATSSSTGSTRLWREK